jgi:hypothetical protein
MTTTDLVWLLLHFGSHNDTPRALWLRRVQGLFGL